MAAAREAKSQGYPGDTAGGTACVKRPGSVSSPGENGQLREAVAVFLQMAKIAGAVFNSSDALSIRFRRPSRPAQWRWEPG